MHPFRSLRTAPSLATYPQPRPCPFHQLILNYKFSLFLQRVFIAVPFPKPRFMDAMQQSSASPQISHSNPSSLKIEENPVSYDAHGIYAKPANPIRTQGISLTTVEPQPFHPFDPYNVRPAYAVAQAPTKVAPQPVWQKIMTDDLCGCLRDIPICFTSLCFPACQAGMTQSHLGSSCVGACICFPCCCGCQRTNVQIALGVGDAGCGLNCCLMCFLMPCAVSQEARAVKAWVLHGKRASQAVEPPALQMQ